MSQGDADNDERSLGKYRVLEIVPTFVLPLARAARFGLKGPDRSGSVLVIQWPGNLLGKVEIHEDQGHPALTTVSSGALASDLENLIAQFRGSVRVGKRATEI